MTLAPGAVEQHLASLAKPKGSLGELEAWAATLCEVQSTLTPSIESMSILVFCGDHGVKKADTALSPFPPAVSQAVFRALAAGLSATATLSRSAGIHLTVVDCGIDGDVADVAGVGGAADAYSGSAGPGCSQCISVVHSKIAYGTANMLEAQAMSDGQVAKAMSLGAECVKAQVRNRQADAIGIGEVGIGNTTVAAALLSALTGSSAADCCGRGTGLDSDGLAHKIDVVGKACKFHHPTFSMIEEEAERARHILKCLGGLEIAAMVGAYIQAYESRVISVVDGFISAVAALCAVRIAPKCRKNMVFSTALAEEPKAPKGGTILSAALGNPRPALSMGLCLGEASGTVLALPILRASAAMVSSMGSLAQVMQLGAK